MSEYLIKINMAGTWQEYYEAYKLAYSDLLQSRWALGATSFAQNIHHTAVPDVSGSTARLVNWAVYSQPSPESFAAFLPVFKELLQSEPNRMLYNRYIFFVAEGTTPSRESVKASLGTIGNRLDFWCISLEEAFSFPEPYSLLLGLDALLGGGTWLNSFISNKQNILQSNPLEVLRAVRSSAIDQLPIASSNAPKVIVRFLIDSFFILLASKLLISPYSIVQVIGEDAAFSALIAGERARTSGWPQEVETYCNDVIEAFPLHTVDYIVKPGDMLSFIIRHHYELPFHLLWPLISVLNPEISDPNLIKIGQRLRLPEISPDLPKI